MLGILLYLESGGFGQHAGPTEQRKQDARFEAEPLKEADSLMLDNNWME